MDSAVFLAAFEDMTMARSVLTRRFMVRWVFGASVALAMIVGSLGTASAEFPRFSRNVRPPVPHRASLGHPRPPVPAALPNLVAGYEPVVEPAPEGARTVVASQIVVIIRYKMRLIENRYAAALKTARSEVRSARKDYGRSKAPSDLTAFQTASKKLTALEDAMNKELAPHQRDLDTIAAHRITRFYSSLTAI
jgi:hypothetical protein